MIVRVKPPPDPLGPDWNAGRAMTMQERRRFRRRWRRRTALTRRVLRNLAGETAGLTFTLGMDLAMHGTAFVLRSPDGTIRRIDPKDVEPCS